MVPCECKDKHQRRRIVLTGGPGAGKTAILELIRQSFCAHVKVLPESASILFGMGFCGQTRRPRHGRPSERSITCSTSWKKPLMRTDHRPSCCAIAARSMGWRTGPGRTTLERGRHDTSGGAGAVRCRDPSPDAWAVVRLRSFEPLERGECTAGLALDRSIAAAWEPHPHRFIIESAADFLEKARQALHVLRGELPQCCRRHVVPSIELSLQQWRR